MTEQELEVMGIHAIAIIIAAEHLAQASSKATVEDWLTLIMAEAKTCFDAVGPEKLEQYLKRTLEAANVKPISWIDGEPIYKSTPT